MGYADFLKTLFPDSYNVTSGEVWPVFLGAIGAALDLTDPYPIRQSAAIPGSYFNFTDSLAYQWCICTSWGPTLDLHGQDLQMPRNPGESDDDYRIRMLSILPFYALGPTVAGITAIIKPFTGIAPVIDEYGLGPVFIPGNFTMGEFYFADAYDLFTFEADVQNPGNVAYNHAALENAIKMAKPARCTAVIVHNGADTSILGEASNAVVVIGNLE